MPRLTSLTRWSLGAAALALAGVGWSWAAAGGAMFSPGELSAAAAANGRRLGGVASHAALAHDCGACHTAPWNAAGMNQRCLECHSDVRRELGDTATLHGMLPGAADCRACHTEHRGADGVLTRLEGKDFDHRRFGFSLAAHRRTAAGAPFPCSDCHGGGSFRFPAARCESCHREDQPDFVARHRRDWGDACQECHDGVDRFGDFDHARTRFALTGAHRDAGCVACHTRVRDLAGFRAAPSGCVACHRDDDAHRGGFGADCGACHGTTDWEEVDFEHAFPLDHGRRGASDCEVCHQDAPRSYRTYTCYGCHEHTPANVRAEHREEGIRDYRDCMECHPTGREEEGERHGRG